MNRRPPLLEGLRPPPPPAALRDRALSAHPALPPDPGERPTWLDRLWQSRPLRLAWTAGVALLLALHALLPGPGASAPAGVPVLPAGEVVAAAVQLSRWSRAATEPGSTLDPEWRLR